MMSTDPNKDSLQFRSRLPEPTEDVRIEPGVEVPVKYRGKVVGRAVADPEDGTRATVYIDPESPLAGHLEASVGDISGLSIYAARTPTEENPNNFEVQDVNIVEY